MDDALVNAVAAVVRALDAEGIRYAITGSVASSIHGEPHTTVDADIVLRMTVEQARRIAEALPQRFYCTEEMLVEAAHSHGSTNVIDAETGFKIDLSVLSPGDFHDSVLSRCRLTPFGRQGPDFLVVSPEDVILMKLVWRRDSGSRKQWDDALGVVRARGATLDWKYLFEYADGMAVTDQLVALRDEGGV